MMRVCSEWGKRWATYKCDSLGYERKINTINKSFENYNYAMKVWWTWSSSHQWENIDYNWSMNHGWPLFVRRLVKISQPVSVTRSVCSNCAEKSPSVVTAVQSSGHCLSRQLPSEIIGSMVNTLPAFITPTAVFSVANVNRKEKGANKLLSLLASKKVSLNRESNLMTYLRNAGHSAPYGKADGYHGRNSSSLHCSHAVERAFEWCCRFHGTVHPASRYRWPSVKLRMLLLPNSYAFPKHCRRKKSRSNHRESHDDIPLHQRYINLHPIHEEKRKKNLHLMRWK